MNDVLEYGMPVFLSGVFCASLWWHHSALALVVSMSVGVFVGWRAKS